MEPEKREGENAQMESVVVTVWCYTYNHKPYIKNAIEGFLSQKTDFKFEVLILDDASTDGTSDIILEYGQHYPDIIKPIVLNRNIGISSVGSEYKRLDIMSAHTRGRYIAYCEGDDVWIDPLKLQIQIGYMERHPECVMSGHNAVKMNYEDGSASECSLYDHETDIAPERLIGAGYKQLMTATMIVRREFIRMEEFFYDSGIGDYTLQLWYNLKGKIHYFDRVMSLYRFKLPDSWTIHMHNEQNHFLSFRFRFIRFLIEYDQYSKGIYRDNIKGQILQQMEVISEKIGPDEIDHVLEHSLREEPIRPVVEYVERYVPVRSIIRQLRDPYYVDTVVRDLQKVCRHFVIMGAGSYGKRMAQQLSNCGIDFDGFVVSDDRKPPEKVMEKPVWRLNALPFDMKCLGVVVALSWPLYIEVREGLKDSEIRYVYPFLFGGKE